VPAAIAIESPRGEGVEDIMRVRLRLTLTTLALIGTAVPLAAETLPAPIVKIEGLSQISDHVYIIPDNSVPLVPNVGYVIGDRAVLVIDTGLGPRNGEAVYDGAKKLAGSKQLYLVTTHVHPEHDLGAQAFPATTKLIRSTDQVKDIAESGLRLAQVFASRSAVNADLLKDADFRKADITFEGDYDLDLGGVRANLVAMGPNHTFGDTIIRVEPDRVLFAGDLAMKA
jgi:glyoxylase-like metal-dependent hydrolase (beta-lactamase superfamily II)